MCIIFLSVLRVCVCVCGVGVQFLFTPLSMCGSLFLSSSPNDSSESLIMNSLWIWSTELWWSFCSASPSLYKHIFLQPLINHRFLLSHRFVWVTGAQSAAVLLQHLTEVSTSAIKLFIIVPQGTCSPAASMMKDCLQFLIEPAKKLKIRLKVYNRVFTETAMFLLPSL